MSVLVVFPVWVWSSATSGGFWELLGPQRQPAALNLTWAWSTQGAAAATRLAVVASLVQGTIDRAALSRCSATQLFREPLSGGLGLVQWPPERSPQHLWALVEPSCGRQPCPASTRLELAGGSQPQVKDAIELAPNNRGNDVHLLCPVVSAFVSTLSRGWARTFLLLCPAGTLELRARQRERATPRREGVNLITASKVGLP